MPTIAILPSDVADQIAAGEVVERPASAVKELVENALDAGATVVAVEVTDGGRSMIRVSDDGCGMDRADALLALQRHATSKIRRTEDLVGVRSFGFRGEALPAIGSVSELLLDTATEAGPGTHVHVAGGSVLAVADAARQRGTTVVVTRLFYNVPARLKFMRGTRTEWRAIADAVTAIGLARRDAHLTLAHEGRTVLTLPAAASLRARVGAVWGAAYADSLIDVRDATGAASVTGLIERPSDVGTRTRRVHLAVNGRAIRDGGLVRAAEAAYRSTIPAGVRPSVFLEIGLAPDTLDVNVHPAKAEVRFRDRWPVERAVESAVRHALGTLASAASVVPRMWSASGGWGAAGEGAAGDSPSPGEPHRSLSWDRVQLDASVSGGLGSGVSAGWGLSSTRGPDGLFTLRPLHTGGGDEAADADATSDGGSETGRSGRIDGGSGNAASDADIRVPALSQLRHTYIMFETVEGLVFIDQHSAHERVLYEQFLTAFDRGSATVQHLLFPFTMHLGAAAAEAFEAHRELFARLGFEVEAFGGQTLVVQGVPSPHPRFDAERCLRETLDALTGDRLPGTAAHHERLIATVACKAAIKAGDELSPIEMRALFVTLARTSLPAHDVHGRSTIIRLPWLEVERRFGRR